MDSKINVVAGDKIKKALASKWSKLTTPEISGIVENHAKLTEYLKSRYSMSKDEALHESNSFFKEYDKK